MKRKDEELINIAKDIKKLLVLMLLKNGSNAREIGQALGVAHTTVLRSLNRAAKNE